MDAGFFISNKFQLRTMWPARTLDSNFAIVNIMDKAHTSKILSLMHSPEDWQTVGNKPRPYCFEIDNRDQSLYYFGANHSRDIEDEQYPKLEQYWKQFLGKTGGKDCVVFVEGGIRKMWTDKEVAVQNDSEAGFITILAHEFGTSVECPEPNSEVEREYLLEKYNKDQIQYYYFARLIPVWHKGREPREVFEEFIKRYQRVNTSSDASWSDYDFSLQNMKEVHRSLFDTSFDEKDVDFFKSIVNPMTEKSIINKVARECTMFRNVHIVTKIEEYWKEGKSIFVVFGHSHAVMQEPALRQLLL